MGLCCLGMYVSSRRTLNPHWVRLANNISRYAPSTIHADPLTIHADPSDFTSGFLFVVLGQVTQHLAVVRDYMTERSKYVN